MGQWLRIVRNRLSALLGGAKDTVVSVPDTEQRLQETEQRLRQLSENIQEVFWLFDAEARHTLYLSPSFEDVWERPAQLLLASPSYLLQTIHPEDVPRIQQLLEEQGWPGFNHDYRILLADGAVRWIHTRCFMLPETQQGEARIAGISCDITEQKRLAQEKDMMARALEQSADSVMITDASGEMIYVNAAFEDISGYAKNEVLGLRPSLLRSGFQDEGFYQRVWQSISTGLPYTDVFINRRKDGELFYEAKTITPLRGSGGEITHYVSTGKDITERLKGRERLQRLLHYDAVSGLVSRVLMHDRLHRAVLHARRLHSRLAVVCLGLGLSELVGDEHGRELYEQMIRLAAERLTETLDEQATVARLGGDEFIVLLKDIEQDDQPEETVRGMLDAFVRPLQARGYELYLSPAAGICLCPQHSDDPDELLRRAELAMQHARHHLAGKLLFYQSEMPGKEECRVS